MTTDSRPGPPRSPALARFARAVACLLLVAGAVIAASDAPAQAAAYRYWSYWWAPDGAWDFAAAGPASSIPADGSVEGWHFGITSITGTATDAPGVNPVDAFARACGSVPPSMGTKRIALVIDPGSPADAPAGQQPGQVRLACAQVPVEANGYQALRSVAPVRTEDGLVCGIDDYPIGECAEAVAAPPASAAPRSPSPQSAAVEQPRPAQAEVLGDLVGPLPLVIGGLAIGAMLGFIWRRRKAT